MKYARLMLIGLCLLGMATGAAAHGGHGGHGGHFASPGQMAGSPHFHPGGQFHGEHGHFDGFHHHRGGAVIFLGAPVFWSWYDPAPYYQAPPVYYDPPVYYIEQGSSDAVSYYCDDPKGYYPDVIDCRSGWRQVTRTPSQ